jgi:hypothetical protein
MHQGGVGFGNHQTIHHCDHQPLDPMATDAGTVNRGQRPCPRSGRTPTPVRPHHHCKQHQPNQLGPKPTQLHPDLDAANPQPHSPWSSPHMSIALLTGGHHARAQRPPPETAEYEHHDASWWPLRTSTEPTARRPRTRLELTTWSRSLSNLSLTTLTCHEPTAEIPHHPVQGVKKEVPCHRPH